MQLLIFLILFSSVSFYFFGIGCFFSPHMTKEFQRYGLVKQRPFIGSLQILGATGLILSYLFSPVLGIISAAGLAILMILGVMVRIKIRDSFLKSIPALVYALINSCVVILWISEL
jgi:hypothetical protein